MVPSSALTSLHTDCYVYWQSEYRGISVTISNVYVHSQHDMNLRARLLTFFYLVQSRIATTLIARLMLNLRKPNLVAYSYLYGQDSTAF